MAHIFAEDRADTCPGCAPSLPGMAYIPGKDIYCPNTKV